MDVNPVPFLLTLLTNKYLPVMFKVKHSVRLASKIYSNFSMKTPEPQLSVCFDVFIVSLKQISDVLKY